MTGKAKWFVEIFLRALVLSTKVTPELLSVLPGWEISGDFWISGDFVQASVVSMVI